MSIVDDLTAWEEETGYLPGALSLYITPPWNKIHPETKFWEYLDIAIKRLTHLEKVDSLSRDEKDFLDHFEPINREYWGF